MKWDRSHESVGILTPQRFQKVLWPLSGLMEVELTSVPCSSQGLLDPGRLMGFAAPAQDE